LRAKAAGCGVSPCYFDRQVKHLYQIIPAGVHGQTPLSCPRNSTRALPPDLPDNPLDAEMDIDELNIDFAAVYQPVNAEEVCAVERVALTWQALSRAEREYRNALEELCALREGTWE
jgi:hypothetical protein